MRRSDPKGAWLTSSKVVEKGTCRGPAWQTSPPGLFPDPLEGATSRSFRRGLRTARRCTRLMGRLPVSVARARAYERCMIRLTGRDETPSMPVRNFALPAVAAYHAANAAQEHRSYTKSWDMIVLCAAKVQRTVIDPSTARRISGGKDWGQFYETVCFAGRLSHLLLAERSGAQAHFPGLPWPSYCPCHSDIRAGHR